MTDTQRQEGIIIMLAIISIGSVFIGIGFSNITLVFSGVATILLDTVLLLDYDNRQKLTEVKHK